VEFFDGDQCRTAGRDIEKLARYLCGIPRADGRVCSRPAAFLALGRLVDMYTEFLEGGLRLADVKDAGIARFPQPALPADAASTLYDDVVNALRGAGLTNAFMGGSGGINIIVVPLTDPEDENAPEFLIGEDADMLDLPTPAALTGWRVLFRPPNQQDDFTIYREPAADVTRMVAAAAAFAEMNGYLPARP
jgi:hypothetical protein